MTASCVWLFEQMLSEVEENILIRRRVRKGSAWQTVAYSRYASWNYVDCASHVILGVLTGRGPRVDVDRFSPLLDATLETTRPERVVADAGYDSEPNHRYAREKRGVRSFMPATLGRPTDKPLKGRHRRRMKRQLNKDYGGYGQRWQVETVFSMIKRRLATAVQGRTYWSQSRKLWLLAITHNLMILYAYKGFLQSRSGVDNTKPNGVIFDSRPFFCLLVARDQ